MLGAGGASRAVVFALATNGAERITIAARRPERAESVRAMAAPLGNVVIDIVNIADDFDAAPDLIVNCTSAGMRHGTGEGTSPIRDDQIDPGGLVYDLVYVPPVTPLLGMAIDRGARTLGGLAMLVHQGAAAFRLWTGLDAPVGLTMARAREALGL